MRVFITDTATNVQRKEVFSSLRAALEWAKMHGKTELYLIREVIKEDE